MALVVESWKRVLTPGSIWEFNFHHHLGKGIHINKLTDLTKSKEDHPSGYVFVLEYLGDRRAKIIRNKDKDFFTGYSPCLIHMDFETRLGYLYDVTKDQEHEAICYRRKRNEEDFEEESDFNTIFTPDREGEFHVNYDNILLPQDDKNRQAEWTLEFDQNIVGSSDNILLKHIKQNFEKAGMDSEDATEDDEKYNLRRPPSKQNIRDYEGTEGEDINLDLTN